MKERVTFPAPDCWRCKEHRQIGNLIAGSRYCMAKGKKGKRFRNSDPRHKPPKWCPKRITPVCRIYSYANDLGKALETDRLLNYLDGKEKRYYADASHYKFRAEHSLGLDAKAFYAKAKEQTVEELLSEVELDFGDLIEIDDGLMPYYFCYAYGTNLIPLPFFNSARLKRAGMKCGK